MIKLRAKYVLTQMNMKKTAQSDCFFKIIMYSFSKNGNTPSVMKQVKKHLQFMFAFSSSNSLSR